MDYSNKSKEELIKELKSLKEHEQNISVVLNNVSEMFYKISFDEKGRKKIDYISPQVEKIFGLSISEYIKNQDKLFEYFHPDELENLRKRIAKIDKNTKDWFVSYRFYHKIKKKYVWIEENINTIFSDKGVKIGLFGSARDITDKKEKEQQLAFLLENIDECIYNVKFNEKEKELTYISPQIKDLLGLTVEEFNKEGINGDLVKRIHPDDAKSIEKLILDGLYKDKKDQINSIIRFKPKGRKEYIWIDETVHAKYDEKGNLKETTTVIRDVTTQKQIDDHYRNIFTKNLAGVFITEDGIIVECNDSFAKIFGYKNRNQLLNSNAEKLYFSNKDRLDYIKELNKKGSLTNYTLRHKDKNGEEVWISTNVTVNKNRIEGTLIDISEQVKKENLLLKSEKNYKSLIDNSPYGTIIHIEGEVVYANPKAFNVLGLESIEQIKGKSNIFDYLLEEYHEKALFRRNKLMNGQEIPFTEVKVRMPLTGKIIDLETKAMIFEFEGQKAIQVVFQDISDKKQLSKERLKTQIAEESNKILQKEIEERKKAEQKLVFNQSYTNNIISSSLDIICATDENKKIREFNKAAELAFGYTRDEVINKTSDLLYKNVENIKKVEIELNKNGFFTGEIVNVKKNGEEFTSFLSASVLYNEEGKPHGAMGVSRDITDIKLAEQQLIESEEKYRDIFENATDLIQSVDSTGNIAYVNKAWLLTLGYTQKEIDNKNIFEFIHEDSKDQCAKFFQEIINNKLEETTRKTFELRTKRGKKIIVEGDISCKFDSDGNPISTRAILRNVTEENKTKNRQEVYNNVSKLITEKTRAEDLYEAIRKELGKVLNTDVFVISYAIDDESISFPYYYDIERGGRIHRPNRTRKRGINEHFLKQKNPQILKRKDLDKILDQGKYELLGPKSKVFIGVPLKTKNKVIGVLSVQSYHNENEYDENTVEILDFISGALALAVQKKYDEEMLFEQSSKLKSVIENSSHLFWTFDKDKGLTTFNQNYSDAVYDLYGKRPQINSKKYNRVEEKSLQPFWDEKYNEAFQGKKVEFITERLNSKNNRTIRECFLNPIFDEDGEVVLVSGIAHDITEKKIAEEQLRDSLKEKEVLLKEVHHRVKNNLQVISSILNLQSSYIEDGQTLSILKESQDRIKSMSIIHESLYQTNDFSKINFSEYIVSLSKNLVHSYSYLDTFVDLKHDIEEVYLNLDISIPCGLIINELVSNALKYAFKDRNKGKIKINLSIIKENVILIVSDDGVGFPEDIDFRETNSLGLQLVTTLVEQIEGTIEMKTEKGTEYTIIFKQA